MIGIALASQEIQTSVLLEASFFSWACSLDFGAIRKESAGLRSTLSSS
jgi:hypothetical protein